MSRAAVCARHNVHWAGPTSAKRTLVLIHGFGTDRTSWDAIVPELARTHRVLMFDNMGAGASDPAAFVQHRYLTLDRYAADVLEILRAHSVHNACLIGHSAGAMMGVLAAIAEPQRVERLVLISASPRYLNDGTYVGGFTEADVSRLYRAVMHNFSDWVEQFAPLAVNRPDKPEVARYFAKTLGRIPPERVLTVLCSILQSDHRAVLERITQPVLILHTRDDYFVPEGVAQYLNQHIANSQRVTIEARGHFPHLCALIRYWTRCGHSSYEIMQPRKILVCSRGRTRTKTDSG